VRKARFVVNEARFDVNENEDVSAVVVNYNAKDELLTCIANLFGEGLGMVLVADNGSSDGSARTLAEHFPAVKCVPTGANLGYGTAANIGAALAGGDYLLVCNPDVVFEEGVVGALRRFLEVNPHVAIVGPRIVDANGALYPSARRFPDMLEALGHGIIGQFWAGNPFSRRYRMTDWDHAARREVDWVSGAFFMARREAWDAVGGFDTSYFMYLEDVDLCWRLRGAGWSIAYEPAAEVTHIQGVSADRHPYRMLLAHHVSMWRFAVRTTRGWRRWLLPLVLVGLAVRLGMTMARRALAPSLAAHSPAAGQGGRPASRGAPEPEGPPVPGRMGPSLMRR
jgi:N-acetylglucosaminyl-diphospho-decaprenol L-rhamnosyltransferase